MNKYTFISYAVFANSEDEALENIQSSLHDNEFSDCFSCVEDEITYEDFKHFNPLGMNKEQLSKITEENFTEYLQEL